MSNETLIELWCQMFSLQNILKQYFLYLFIFNTNKTTLKNLSPLTY